MKYYLILIYLSFSTLLSAQTKISPEQAYKTLSKNKKAQLVDVRTAAEYEQGYIKNSLNINWNKQDEFKDLITQLNKKKPVYIYCKSGGRSAKAAQYLTEQGFEVFEIEGGALNWNAKNLPLEMDEFYLENMDLPTFESTIKSHPLVLIDFYAEWCGPCGQIAPSIKKITQKYGNKVKVVKIDVDKNKDLISQLGITKIPSLIIFKDGKETWSHQGYISFKKLEKQIQ